MTKLLRNAVVAVSMGSALVACGNNSSAPPAPAPVTPPVAAKLEDGFGTGFGMAFRMDANIDAKDPVAGDLIPLSLTTEPVTI